MAVDGLERGGRRARADSIERGGGFLVLHEVLDAASVGWQPDFTTRRQGKLVLLRSDDRDEQQARAGDAVEREAMQQRQQRLSFEARDLGPREDGRRIPAVARQSRSAKRASSR